MLLIVLSEAKTPLHFGHLYTPFFLNSISVPGTGQSGFGHFILPFHPPFLSHVFIVA
jgi:hypothetical protein